MAVPVLLFLLAFGARLLTAVLFGEPAYPDSFYYVNVAHQLAAGHGFNIDFIWNFVEVGGRLPAQGVLPIPSNAHWMPLAALIQVPFIWLLGPITLASGLPFWIVGAAVAPVTWWIGRDAGLPDWQAFAAALLVTLPGAVAPYLAQPDNFSLFMLLGALALWACARGLRGDRRAFALGGLVVGLAFLSRNDGVLLGVPFALAFLVDLARRRPDARLIGWRAGLLCAGGFLLLASPWLLRQLAVFGSLSPSSASGRILWITDYRQLYSIGGDSPTLATFLAQGLSPLLASRAGGLVAALGIFAAMPLLLFLAPFTLLGAWLRRREAAFVPWLMYALTLFAFSGLLFAVHVPYGTFLHSAVALLPHAYLLSLVGLGAAVTWIARRRPSWDAPRATRVFSAMVVGVVLLGAVAGTWLTVRVWRAEHDLREQVATALADVPHADRLMSPDAGGYRYLTGREGIVTPDDPLPVVEAALRAYDVRWLVLERDHITSALAPLLAGSQRPAWLSAPVLVVPAPTTGTGHGFDCRRRHDGTTARRALRGVLLVGRHPLRTVTTLTGSLPARRSHATGAAARLLASTWLVPLALFGLALAARAVAAALVPFPPNEGSAYYVDVAGNLAAGRGLLADSVWSYATPPLVVPRPAFELWLPMASLVSALPMLLFGATFSSAQAGSVVLGATVAPLTWAVAREAADRHGLDARRSLAVALCAGALAAVLGPFLTAAAGPDSSTPFLVAGTLAALLMPRALATRGAASIRGRLLPGIVLGLVLGLAYLSRQEAIWLAVAFVILTIRSVPRGVGRERLQAILGVLLPVVVGGLLVVLPWLARQAATFGTPLPGQTLDNALLVRNEDIFAFLDRPGLAAFLSQGPLVLAGNVARAFWHELVNVLLLPAFPVALAGGLSMMALRRSPALRGPTALAALLLSGGLTLVSTALAFPVATLWGTFLHASGPLLVGLTVCAALGGDALLARISTIRRWQAPNVMVAPVALLAVTMALAGLGVMVQGRATRQIAERMTAIAGALRDAAGPAGLPAALISDHPMWLSDVLDRPVVALPDEPPASLARLADTFGAPWLIVVDERGRYPAALLDAAGSRMPRRGSGRRRAGRAARLAVPPGPGVRPAMSLGTEGTSPYTRATMETGTLGERRADVDALYAEAKKALGQSANQLRSLTERLREMHADELLEWQRRGGSDGNDEGRERAADVSHAAALLTRLELTARRLDETWSFLERGQAGDWSATGRSAADALPLGDNAPPDDAMVVLEAQEQERARLAEELHDGPAQSLANAVFRVDIVERAMRVSPEAASAELLELRVMLEREAERLRDFIPCFGRAWTPMGTSTAPSRMLPRNCGPRRTSRWLSTSRGPRQRSMP